jgi:RNA polymerase-binding transcription factor DksA
MTAMHRANGWSASWYRALAFDAVAIDRVFVLSDLTTIDRDLGEVDVALTRLDEGTFWTCEITGHPLPDTLLATEPVARRLVDKPGA